MNTITKYRGIAVQPCLKNRFQSVDINALRRAHIVTLDILIGNEWRHITVTALKAKQLISKHPRSPYLIQIHS